MKKQEQTKEQTKEQTETEQVIIEKPIFKSKRIPSDRIIKQQACSGKAKCESCFKFQRVKHICYFKGKYLCHFCRNKQESYRIMQSASQIGRDAINKEQALTLNYKVKTYWKDNKPIHCLVSIPRALAFYNVKLEIVGEQKQEKLKLLEYKTHKDKDRKKRKVRKGRGGLYLDKIKDEVRTIKLYGTGESISGALHLPTCYAGKIISLKLIDEGIREKHKK